MERLRSKSISSLECAVAGADVVTLMAASWNVISREVDQTAEVKVEQGNQTVLVADKPPGTTECCHTERRSVGICNAK